jgi:hypothetical protein
MRYLVSISRAAAVLALLALGVAAGPAPAEAKGAPPKSVPHGKDTTAPTITCPSGITTDSTAFFGAVVTFTVSATDDKDPAPRITVSPNVGSTFPVGTTTVTVTATDWKLNTSTKTFDVTVRPQSGPRNYKAYWADAEGYAFFEWDITVAADGTVSGSGHQTNALDVYSTYEMYAAPLPSGLEGTGVVSGTVAADGSFQLESSSTYWYWDAGNGEIDADGNPVYVQGIESFSGSLQAQVYSNGNLLFSVNPLPSPSSSNSYGYWVVQ